MFHGGNLMPTFPVPIDHITERRLEIRGGHWRLLQINFVMARQQIQEPSDVFLWVSPCELWWGGCIPLALFNPENPQEHRPHIAFKIFDWQWLHFTIVCRYSVELVFWSWELFQAGEMILGGSHESQLGPAMWWWGDAVQQHLEMPSRDAPQVSCAQGTTGTKHFQPMMDLLRCSPAVGEGTSKYI